jgi:hypothetical protein
VQDTRTESCRQEGDDARLALDSCRPDSPRRRAASKRRACIGKGVGIDRDALNCRDEVATERFDHGARYARHVLAVYDGGGSAPVATAERVSTETLAIVGL